MYLRYWLSQHKFGHAMRAIAGVQHLATTEVVEALCDSVEMDGRLVTLTLRTWPVETFGYWISVVVIYTTPRHQKRFLDIFVLRGSGKGVNHHVLLMAKLRTVWSVRCVDIWWSSLCAQNRFNQERLYVGLSWGFLRKWLNSIYSMDWQAMAKALE